MKLRMKVWENMEHYKQWRNGSSHKHEAIIPTMNSGRRSINNSGCSGSIVKWNWVSRTMILNTALNLLQNGFIKRESVIWGGPVRAQALTQWRCCGKPMGDTHTRHLQHTSSWRCWSSYAKKSGLRWDFASMLGIFDLQLPEVCRAHMCGYFHQKKFGHLLFIFIHQINFSNSIKGNLCVKFFD